MITKLIIGGRDALQQIEEKVRILFFFLFALSISGAHI
jgi:hypothetical protein